MITEQRLKEKDTRFALPIICPSSGEIVSAETLYNRCCDAMGYVVRDHISDLIFDNLDYSRDPFQTAEYYEAVLTWAQSVRTELGIAK